jgi:hypothetical protein
VGQPDDGGNLDIERSGVKNGAFLSEGDGLGSAGQDQNDGTTI